MTETQLLIPGESENVVEIPPSPLENKNHFLTDLRTMAMAAPVEIIEPACDAHCERKVVFFSWLMKKLVKGVHYGVVPGCEPKFDDNGNLLVAKKNKDGSFNGYMVIGPDQWIHKPSLYKPGADFISDLMGLRATYKPDAEAQRQLMCLPDKSMKAVIVMRCRLLSRITKEIVGEGWGARTLWQKGGDANNTIKMAKKCAKVDAVIDSYGLSDLFTQDLEDGKDVAPHEAPEQKPNAPKAQPRSTGINEFEFTELKNRYCACRPFPRGESEAKKQFWIKFQQFVQGATGNLVPVTELNDYNAWTRQMINQVHEKIRMELE